MEYQLYVNENGERLWIPLLAGAAILTAPFWLNRPCCGNNYNNGGYVQPMPYPYPQPMPYPQPVPQPYPYPQPVPQPYPYPYQQT